GASGSTGASDVNSPARPNGSSSYYAPPNAKAVLQNVPGYAPAQASPQGVGESVPPGTINQNSAQGYVAQLNPHAGPTGQCGPAGCGRGCGPPCGPPIPYVPYSAQQAPYAPAFFPCPYYPPCYCYSGQLCATSPCLCPPACGQQPYGPPPYNWANPA